jgi:hypothetical protein
MFIDGVLVCAELKNCISGDWRSRIIKKRESLQRAKAI